MSISRREAWAIAAVVLGATLACKQRSKASAATGTAEASAPTAEADAADSPEAQKGRVAKKIATLNAIAKEKLPPISSRRSLKAGPLKPTLDGFVNAPNAAIAAPEQLAELRVDRQVPSYASVALNWCAVWVRGEKPTIDSMHANACDRYRYVVVMRFSRLVKPKMTGPSRFRPGSCAGDATVFDIETGKRLGSVPFSGTNSAELDAIQGVEQGRIESDLNRQCTWSAQVAIDEIFGDPTKP